MENIDKNLLEDTVGSNAANIATTDENLSISQLFQQVDLPSLGRQIFSVVPMHGPTAALFNIRKKSGTNDLELVRNEVEVYPSVIKNTALSTETVQDLKAQFGKNAKPLVSKLLRGIANEDENTKTLAFLDAECKSETALTLTDTNNALTTHREISQKVSALIAKANSKNFRTYEAFCVVPYNQAGTIIAQSNVGRDNSFGASGLFVGKYGQTNYFINPDPLSTTVYVGLRDSKDISKSAAVFSPYQEEIIDATDPDSGEMKYFIANRFAITKSPLHVTDNEMMFKFDLL